MKFSNPFKKKQQPMPDDTVRNDEEMQNENENRYEDFVNQDRDDNYEGRDGQIRRTGTDRDREDRPNVNEAVYP